MKEENYEITTAYLNDLKKLLDSKSGNVTKYQLAHAAFRKKSADWIISDVNNLTITYLSGAKRTMPTYNELMKRIKMSNEDYKPSRRKYIARYWKIINIFNKHRSRFKNKRNTIANSLSPQQIKALASQI
tara:strand:+ start:1315 stop:1704 length:390 start_codon:yes stop_codon:yes gene_type:complete